MNSVAPFELQLQSKKNHLPSSHPTLTDAVKKEMQMNHLSLIINLEGRETEMAIFN